MTTAKVDHNILHLFQHRPQIILGDITVTRKMDRTPDSAEQNNKSVLFSMIFHERRMQNPAVWQQQCPDQCQCEIRSQTTRLGTLANCAPLAVASRFCETTATSRVSILCAPRPRQRAPRLQAMTSLSAVIPNNSASSAVATGAPDVVVRRGIGCTVSESCTYT